MDRKELEQLKNGSKLIWIGGFIIEELGLKICFEGAEVRMDLGLDS